MKRPWLPLALTLFALSVLLPLFAWLQAVVGYETFATGGVILCAALAIIAVLLTAITLRRDRNKESSE